MMETIDYLIKPQSQWIPVGNKEPLSDVKFHSIYQEWFFYLEKNRRRKKLKNERLLTQTCHHITNACILKEYYKLDVSLSEKLSFNSNEICIQQEQKATPKKQLWQDLRNSSAWTQNGLNNTAEKQMKIFFTSGNFEGNSG